MSCYYREAKALYKEALIRRHPISRLSFTLIELLVVISIIALLIALLMPALQKARKVAQAAMCMSNSRQLVSATMSYLYDNNGFFPRAVASLPGDPEAWQPHTHYLFTLEPYFNDWKILADPGRDNPEVPPENRSLWEWRSINYWVVGHGYAFYDERDLVNGMAAMTQIDDVARPSKSLLVNCVFWWRGRDNQDGLWGSEDIFPGAVAWNSRDNKYEPTTPGGIHNGTEEFTFFDGHAALFSTTPIREWWLATKTYAYTYPPNVTPAEAQWWTVPYYPKFYPYYSHKALPGY